jgi:hypothetical protein
MATPAEPSFIDYTTPTEWECLIKDLEGKLESAKSHLDSMEMKCDFFYRGHLFCIKVSAVSAKSTLSHLLPPDIPLDPSNIYELCFADEFHRWLAEPVILYLDTLDAAATADSNLFKMVQCAAVVAISNLKWFVPLIAPCSKSSSPGSVKYFLYKPAEGHVIRILDLLSGASIPRYYTNLSGLGRLFQKSVQNASINITTACSFHYQLENWIQWDHSETQPWTCYLSSQVAASNIPLVDGESTEPGVESTRLPDLVIPTGCMKVPIKYFNVEAVWPLFPMEKYIENEAHSDLTLKNAPVLFLSIVCRKLKPQKTRLSSSISFLFHLESCLEQNPPANDKFPFLKSINPDIKVLDIAQIPVLPGLVSIGPRISIEQLIKFLFAESIQSKSMVISSMNLSNHSDFYRCLCSFWLALVESVSKAFRNLTLFSSLDTQPNLVLSLLDQKLCLLNYCISKELKESATQRKGKSYLTFEASSYSDSSSTEEFHDAEDHLQQNDTADEEYLADCLPLTILSVNGSRPLLCPKTQVLSG